MTGTSHWLACMPALAALALVALLVWRMWITRCENGGGLSTGDLMWALPHAGLLLLVAAFAAGGGLEADVGKFEIGAYSLVLFLCGASVLVRSRFNASLTRLSRRLSTAIRSLIAFATLSAVSIASAWMVDYAWMESIGGIQLQFFGLTAILFFVVSAALYFIGQRSGGLVSIVPVCAAGFGIAQYFVILFKGVPIMPMDLLSLKTAGAIAAGYDYVLTSNMIRVLCTTAISLCALSFVRPGARHESRKVRVGFAFASLFVGVTLVAGLATFFNGAKLEERIGVGYDRWMPINTYQALGFVPTFIEIAQDLEIPEPEEYDRGQTETLIKDLAREFDETAGAAPERKAAEEQFNELKPAVIGIMNETFADMSVFDGIRNAGYEGPRQYNSLAGVIQRGPLMVSVYGGGTANSEFEFLTGNSMAFMGTGKYAYQLYDLSEVDSLVKQFEELGYASAAMHPQDPVNWKRSTAYKQLGFDEFLSISDFEGAPVYHAGVTDAATYDKIIELLERNDAPQFIFDVTMQNHGGYGAGSVPAEDVVQLDIPGVSPEVATSLGVYLACIERSDSDLAYFIERLQALDRPVVLVFFGDHQPGMDESLYGAIETGLDPVSLEQKKHQTTYVVWSNYEVAGFPAEEASATSSSQLAASVLYRIGAPLTDRQKADYMLSRDVPALSLAGYLAADGQMYALEAETPWSEALNLKRAIQYARFAEKA